VQRIFGGLMVPWSLSFSQVDSIMKIFLYERRVFASILNGAETRDKKMITKMVSSLNFSSWFSISGRGREKIIIECCA
jgi:hypothetical protein